MFTFVEFNVVGLNTVAVPIAIVADCAAKFVIVPARPTILSPSNVVAAIETAFKVWTFDVVVIAVFTVNVAIFALVAVNEVPVILLADKFGMFALVAVNEVPVTLPADKLIIVDIPE